MSCDAYTVEEILALIDQLFDTKRSLGNMEQQHRDQLLCSLRSFGYNQSREKMSVWLQADINLAEASNATMLMLDCPRILHTLKDRYVLATLNRRHWCSCDSQLFAESDRGWAGEHLRMQLTTRLNKKLLTSKEVIKQSQVENVSSTIVRGNFLFVEQKARVLNYPPPLSEEYGLPFWISRTADSLQDMTEP